MRQTDALLFINVGILLVVDLKSQTKQMKHLASCLGTKEEPSFIIKYISFLEWHLVQWYQMPTLPLLSYRSDSFVESNIVFSSLHFGVWLNFDFLKYSLFSKISHHGKFKFKRFLNIIMTQMIKIQVSNSWHLWEFTISDLESFFSLQVISILIFLG